MSKLKLKLRLDNLLRNLFSKTFFRRLYEKAFDNDIFGSAAQVGFYFIFAVFPLLLFIINGFSLILGKTDNLRAIFFGYMQQIMPPSAFLLLETTLTEILESSSGGKLTLGFLLAIWSASVGIDSIRIGLNAVYEFKETRSFWKQKLIAVLITIGIGILILISLSGLFYGTLFLSDVLSSTLVQIFSFSFIIIILTLIFAIIYSFCPNHPKFSWTWISPGAIIAILLWLISSIGFRVYLSYFDTYEKTYGSLGALIILVLWLYITALVILIGGAVNAVLDELSNLNETNPTKNPTFATNK